MDASAFLQNVLGLDGFKALEKAKDRAPILESILLPRTIVAWLGTAARLEYAGEIPGLDNSQISLTKTEDGGLSGSITVGVDTYPFHSESLLYVAAALGVALGVEGSPMHSSLKGQDLSRLGKSIDLLVRGRFASVLTAEEDLAKRLLDPGLGYKFTHEHHDVGAGQKVTKVNVHSPTGEHVGAATFMHHPGGLKLSTVVVDDDHQRLGIGNAMFRHAAKVTGKPITDSTQQTSEGAALWGATVKPPQPTVTKTERPTQGAEASTRKVREAVISKSDADRECEECGGRQFANAKFVGCMCWRSLSKGVKATVAGETYTLRFTGADWDEDAVFALVSSLKGT